MTASFFILVGPTSIIIIVGMFFSPSLLVLPNNNKKGNKRVCLLFGIIIIIVSKLMALNQYTRIDLACIQWDTTPLRNKEDIIRKNSTQQIEHPP